MEVLRLQTCMEVGLCSIIGSAKSGVIIYRISHHAPAADAPAITQKSGGAFGIPELTPPIRRQDFQSIVKRNNFSLTSTV